VRSVDASPDYALIRSWLAQCDKEHNQCRTDGNIAKLELIELIDVRKRCLVRYKPGMQYVALSYVWGHGIPVPERKQPQELPINISKTIQHAMVITENIGIRYLWADAVCIDQHNRKEKLLQIPLMDYIYEQAFATIIALGEHANVGLPGVDGGPRRQHQLVAEFGPVKLLSRCPTLSSQINQSVWSSRGWTYQEGLFSRRCIVFSEHQVYFHCNEMLCTEDSPSPVYVSPANNPRITAHLSPYWNIDRYYIIKNTLWKNPVVGNIYTYIEYLGQYVCRDISRDTDAVNAFGAVLSRMERDFFRSGFIYGIPRDAFREGLLWATVGAISRRMPGDPPNDVPNDFPSWSWAGWRTRNSLTYCPVARACDSEWDTIVPHPLSISFDEECLYSSQTTNMRLSDLGLELQALWAAYLHHPQTHSPPRTNFRSPASNALYIDGPILRLPVTYNDETQVIGFMAPNRLPKVRMVELVPMIIERSRDGFWPVSPAAAKEKLSPRDFLVMRTSHELGYAYLPEIQFTLMMLDWTDNSCVATRAGILTLRIEANLGEFWKFAEVRRSVFWII
jgi:hypothetical protein